MQIRNELDLLNMYILYFLYKLSIKLATNVKSSFELEFKLISSQPLESAQRIKFVPGYVFFYGFAFHILIHIVLQLWRNGRDWLKIC